MIIQEIKPKDRLQFKVLGLDIRYYKHCKRTRFNKNAFFSNKTLRCKILYIISIIFNLKIQVPEFEWKARGRDKYGQKIN